MRFDLEIPATKNIELTYIKEGQRISNGLVPLVYIGIDTSELFPEDFITSNAQSSIESFIVSKYEKINGPSIINVKSNKFLITNIYKYISNNKAIPLFFKHEIPLKIKSSSIKIVDFFGVIQDKSLYKIEEEEDSTTIYLNKNNKILFAEYSSEKSTNKVLLNLEPVFSEAGWEDILNGEISKYKYILDGNNIKTAHDEDLYIVYLSDVSLFRNATGNIDDPWYISILNTEFNHNGNKYRIPEYYLQSFSSDSRSKLVTHKKCRIIHDSYIKSQYNISHKFNDSIYVYVYNKFTNRIKNAFTTNSSLSGKLYKDNIVYKLITDFNSDGIIYLPIKLTTEDVVYATHYTNEEYYEYKMLDLNSSISDYVDYFAIYIKPNVSENGYSISHAMIGSMIQNSQFESYKTIEDYENAINDPSKDCFNAFTVCLISVNDRNINSIEYHDIRSTGNKIIDKYSACKENIDILYNDIINNNISIPTNDALIANVNIKKYLDSGYLTYNTETKELNDFSKKFVSNMLDIIHKNLDASTDAIVEINLNNKV